jgi:hypothetical protein
MSWPGFDGHLKGGHDELPWEIKGTGSLFSPRSPPFSIFSLGGGLEGLPLHVSNEGLLRPRVARAQETI